MITVKKYNSNDKENWNLFIKNSKNATFILNRDYIEYHSDRYTDFSLMFYEERELLAVLPASLYKDELRSHDGLTYGGVISNKKMTADKMMKIFEILKEYLRENKIKKLLYKCVPNIYHLYPADEDLYALFRNSAKLIRRDISTAIYLPEKINFSELRKRGIKKAKKNELIVRESDNFEDFVNLLTKVLTKYHNTKPVHSAQELKLLSSCFPKEIKLFAAYNKNVMMAGVLVFNTYQTIHTQYIVNSDEGRNMGALDLIIDYLVNIYSAGKMYFDFGISTEQDGNYLNSGLISQKEMFGGRGIVYDHYEMQV